MSNRKDKPGNLSLVLVVFLLSMFKKAFVHFGSLRKSYGDQASKMGLHDLHEVPGILSKTKNENIPTAFCIMEHFNIPNSLKF